MNKLLSLVSLALISTFAAAEQPRTMVCESDDSSTIVVLEMLRTDVKPEEEGPATAQLMVVKLKGYSAGNRFPLTGYKQSSAKGPYFELSNGQGLSFFVSAIASKSYDELNMKGIKTDLVCSPK